MNKYIKKTLMSVMLGSMSFLLFSCGGMLQIGTPTPSEEVEESTSETIKPGTSEEGTQILSQQEKIYQLAKASGYQGTYEQWLESIKGDQVVIAVVNNALQWRYASETQWTMLIDLSELKGEDGHTPYIGKNGNWWINGADTGVNATGQMGLTPHVGKNGNWWLGDEDTGVYAGGTEGVSINSIEYVVNEDYSITMNIILTNGEISSIVIPSQPGKDGNTPYIGWNGNWWIGEEDTGVYAGGQSSELTKEMHSVTFHYDDGSTYSVEVECGHTVDNIGYNYIEGKEFEGWYYENGDQEWMFDFYPVTKDINLYARYENIIYSMYLEEYGEYQVAYGEYYDLPELSKPGYDFLGWEFYGQSFADTGWYNYTYDIVLTPVWDKQIADETKYDVIFNTDSYTEGLTVWTDYAIDGTIAPNAKNISEKPGIEDRHTVPLAEGGIDCGIYFFAVDANGYIVYASYGLGVGYGGPGDGYYHNQDSKDPFNAPYWSLHDEFAFWPNRTPDGRNAWTLYDFVVPEGGFVVKGYSEEANMKDLWLKLTGQLACPKSSNTTLEANIVPGSLNDWYFSINSEHQLSIRERTYDEIAIDGVQKNPTPSKNFESSPSDEVIGYTSLSSIKELADNELVENVRGVITHINGGNVTIQDEFGDAILLYDIQLREGYAVGETIVFNGTKTTYSGHPEIKSLTSIKKIDNYGKLDAVEPIEVNENNVHELWIIENNYKLFKLVKAQVKALGQNAKVQLGDVEITLYKAHMPEIVEVGDYIDVVCSMQSYNANIQGRTSSEQDISRYEVNLSIHYKIGGEEYGSFINSYNVGDEVVLNAYWDDSSYEFSHWEKLVGYEWQFVSNELTFTIIIDRSDEHYKMVFEKSEFTDLDETYAQVYDTKITKINMDCGGDNLSVITDPTAVFHENGAWANGLFNTSWRLIVAVDSDGKIAYLVKNPANGYGGPSGTGYYAHPDYYDYTTNPALNILEGYGPWTPENPSTSSKFEIKVPEGGFIIVSHGTASNDLLNAIKNDFVDVSYDANVNNRESINKDIRILFGKNNNLRAYKNELDENALVNAIINEKSDNYPTIYTSESSDVVLGDFTVAVDSDGKIIFISKTAAGYGGPADGFYHDGSYQLEPGKQCGIFKLYNDFAGWPNVTPDGLNAWTQYEVVVPEGCYVITGNWDQMSNFLTSIDEKAYEQGNYFEGVADGIYNDTHCLIVNIANNVGNIYLNKSEINVSNLVYTGSYYGDFTYNEATGLYEATVNLNTWNNIVFTYTDKSGNQITLNHDNSNLVGYFTESSFFGCDWTANLYRESYDGKFYTCTGGLYGFTFDPNTMTLTASIVNNLNVIQSNVTIDRTNLIGWSDTSYWSDIASAAGDVDFTIEYQLYGGTELWQTSLFVIHYGNGGMNVAVSRADNWGWVDSYNGENQLGNFTAGSMSGNLSTETYKDCNVTLNVKRQGSFIYLTYNVQATNGNSITFTQEYAGVTAEELIFSFTAEFAKIVVNNVY